jgi:hypothetical protein
MSDPRKPTGGDYTGIFAVVARGKEVGVVLRPHRGKDGRYIASLTRFAKDYIRVDRYEDLHDWLREGYRIRMSNADSIHHRAPSLISPGSIQWD